MFIRHSGGCLFILRSGHALGTETLSTGTASALPKRILRAGAARFTRDDLLHHSMISPSGERKRVEKLRYIHNNPVSRGLVANPEERAWSSSRHYASGEESLVEIESWWAAKRREVLGMHPTVRCVS